MEQASVSVSLESQAVFRSDFPSLHSFAVVSRSSSSHLPSLPLVLSAFVCSCSSESVDILHFGPGFPSLGNQ